MNAGAEARRFLRHLRYGVLSTLSRKFGGYPFASVTPYVLDHAAHPVILVSKLAEHTRNMDADSRVSLLVRDAGDDVQAGARLTLIGNAGRASDATEALHARYLNYVPDAGRLIALGDFSFYRIEPLQLRFIGGFGAIHWIAAESYAPPANEFAAKEEAILAHMNADHAQTLRNYCRFYHRREAMTATMIGIDCDGFDVRADREILRFDFEQTLTNGADARAALVTMAQASRSA
jgi:putative heme iron utilization protein